MKVTVHIPAFFHQRNKSEQEHQSNVPVNPDRAKLGFSIKWVSEAAFGLILCVSGPVDEDTGVISASCDNLKEAFTPHPPPPPPHPRPSLLHPPC